MGRDSGGNRWVILTTGSSRTLALADGLIEFGAWTPRRAERRKGRGKKRDVVVQFDVPITPTFVFVPAEHLAEMLRIRALPTSPHPAFRMLQFRDRIPVVSDAGLRPLRSAEERFRASLLKTIRRRVEPGTSVRVSKGGFAGMTGIVESSTEKDAKVNFGGGFVVKIASYLIGTDVVQAEPQSDMDLAA